MSQHSRSRPFALILSCVPGWGHVYWGRELLGLALFTIAAFFGFVYVNSVAIYHGEGREALSWVSGLMFLVLAVGTWVDLYLRTSPVRLERDEESRLRLLRQGTVAYLKAEYESAQLDFRACLRIDPQDVEALFRLGVACARSGDVSQAKKYLRRTLRFDLEEKWSWEINRELARLSRAEPVGDSPEGAEAKEEQTESASA